MPSWITTFATTALLALAIGVGGYLLSIVLSRLTRSILERTVDHTTVRFIANFVLVIGLITTGYYVIDQAGVTGVLVILATAITGAFALGSERIASDTIAGIKLFFVRYYAITDWVTIGDYYGEVKEINLTYTSVETLERDLILIPNADAVNAVITNHSKVEGHYLSARIPIRGEHDRMQVVRYLDEAARQFEPRIESLEPEVMLEDLGVNTSYYMTRVIVPDYAWDLPNEARFKLELVLFLEGKSIQVGEAVPFLIRES